MSDFDAKPTSITEMPRNSATHGCEHRTPYECKLEVRLRPIDCSHLAGRAIRVGSALPLRNHERLEHKGVPFADLLRPGPDRRRWSAQHGCGHPRNQNSVLERPIAAEYPQFVVVPRCALRM